MPHDRDGEVLSVGDTVYVPVKITAIHLTEDYCNVNLETLQPMPPSHTRTELHLNAKQVIKNCLDPRTAARQIKTIKKDATPEPEALRRPMTI